MKVLGVDEIRQILPDLDLIPAIEAAFVAYSAGHSVVPPVGELLLDDPPGEVHIKYGYIRGDEAYVVKIASGFYQNADLGLPSGNGLMAVFSQRTGEVEAILHDEGYLTDVRTAVAGAVAAKHLAPSSVDAIGVVGTGVQARMQMHHLKSVIECRDVFVWGRDDERVKLYAANLGDDGFTVTAVSDPSSLLQSCQLIVTTTPATEPLIQWATDLGASGLHLTAVGSDMPTKQELDISVLQRADRVIVDSRSQCATRGETHWAIEAGVLDPASIVELGAVIDGTAPGRTNESDVTVADLTGVAVQDVAIAQAVLSAPG